MNKAFPVSVEDPGADCPVSPGVLDKLYRADLASRSDLLLGISETTRARLAVWLYGRSHTHELGVCVATTCEGSALRRVAGLLGNALYDLSRQPFALPTHGTVRTAAGRRISLAGSSIAAAPVAA